MPSNIHACDIHGRAAIIRCNVQTNPYFIPWLSRASSASEIQRMSFPILIQDIFAPKHSVEVLLNQTLASFFVAQGVLEDATPLLVLAAHPAGSPPPLPDWPKVQKKIMPKTLSKALLPLVYSDHDILRDLTTKSRRRWLTEGSNVRGFIALLHNLSRSSPPRVVACIFRIGINGIYTKRVLRTSRTYPHLRCYMCDQMGSIDSIQNWRYCPVVRRLAHKTSLISSIHETIPLESLFPRAEEAPPPPPTGRTKKRYRERAVHRNAVREMLLNIKGHRSSVPEAAIDRKWGAFWFAIVYLYHKSNEGGPMWSEDQQLWLFKEGLDRSRTALLKGIAIPTPWGQ